MKGNYFLGAEHTPKFELREMNFDMLGPHQVKVKNMACGVCGTDVHIYHGEKGSAAVTPPVVLGHEYAGIVVEVGEAVTNVKVGDHVTMDPNMYCGICRPCRMGRKQNCEHLYALGVNTNGGFAEYSVCPDTQCYLLDPSLSFDVGAMTEPLACAIHGVDKVGVRSGDVVLVIGGGAIGLMMVQLAKLAGAAKVVLSEPIAVRREIGLSVGADFAIDPTSSDLNQEFQAFTGLDGADVVIECVGRPIAAKQAIAAAGLTGKVLLFSVPAPDATIELPLFDVYKKELTIVGSMINPDTHERAVALLNSGRMQMEPLITHRFPLAQLEDAIRCQMGTESVKVIVRPQE